MPKTKSPIHAPHKKGNRAFLVGVLGFSLAVFGILLGTFWETTFNTLVEHAMRLQPNSKLYDVWKSPPLTLTLDMYLFNWTNPEDFFNHSTKPHLKEIGPYRFIEKPDKVDINWHPENASVTYRRKSKFYFDAAGSNGTLNDTIVTVNILAVAVSRKAKHMNPMRRTIIDLALNVYGNDLSLTKTADELLFGGFHDVLLSMGNFIPPSIINLNVPYDKFGYCYGRNNSPEFLGVFNVHTGVDDITKAGQMHTWNYGDKTKFFPSECADVKGSAGEFHPMYMKPTDNLNFFVPDLCRSLYLEYEHNTDVDGIPAFKYIGGLESVDNGTINPANKCFCNGECVPSGAMNISSCWYGAAAFMSYPHFYNADPFYVQQIDGLHPQKDKHEFYLKIEPKTGSTLEFAARFQANILIEPMPQFSMFQNVPKVFFPLFWFEERSRITPDLVAELKILPVLILAGQLFGGLCFIVGVVLSLWYPLRWHYSSRLIQQIEINELDAEEEKKSKSVSSSIFKLREAATTYLEEKPANGVAKTISLDSNNTDAHRHSNSGLKHQLKSTFKLLDKIKS